MKRMFRVSFLVQFDRDDDAPDPINDPKQYMEDRADALAEGVNDKLDSYDFYVTFEKMEEVK